MQVNRRKFLIAGAGVTAVAGTGAAIANHLGYLGGLSPGARGMVAKIRQELDFLKFKDTVVSQFLTDYEQRVRRIKSDEPLTPRFVHRFLLSTDFFQMGEDEARELNYVMLYHPYASPCYNPLRVVG